MKSKTSATTMMKTTAVSTGGAVRRSRHLEDDSLDHVRHVLAAVGDGLQRLIDLLPLDHLDRVRLLVEHRREALAQQAVGAVLEPVHLRSEEHTSELQSPDHLVCRLLLEKKKNYMSMERALSKRSIALW